MRDLLLFGITAMLSVTALRNPAYGMLAYVGFSLLGPHSMTWSQARTFPHVQVIAVCTIIGYFLSAEPKRIPRGRESALLMALWLTFVVSTLLALSVGRALEELVHMSKVLLMVFLAMALINTERRVHLLLRVIALSIGFYGFKVGLFVVRTGGQSAVWGPDATFLEANNALGMAMAMNVPLLFHLARMESNVWLRRVMWMMLIGSYPAVIGTFSRGAWLALGAATVALAVRSRFRMLTLCVVFLAIVTMVSWFPQVASRQLTGRFESLANYEEDGSAQSRFWNWEFCQRVAIARPVFGGGFRYYSTDAYARFYPEFLERWPGKVWSCHNMWLSILSEHGGVGFGLWCGLMVSGLLSLRQMRALSKRGAHGAWMARYADMLEAAFVGFIVNGIFVDIAYYEVYYFLVAVIIVVKEQIRRRQQTEVRPDAMGSEMGMKRATFVPSLGR